MDNMELFEEEIETIREYSELDVKVFHEVLDCTRDVISQFGNDISPAAVVDIIEGAVGNLIHNFRDKPMTVEEAVSITVVNLHLLDEVESMIDESDSIYDDNDNKKSRK